MKHNSDNGWNTWNTKSVSQDTFHPDRPESKFRRNAEDALVKIPKTGNCRLWLTWKLIRKQKLCTAAIFCGLMLSCCLLDAFGSFGYDFWTQVHEGGGEAAGYDQTQLILISLVTVLLSLVAACSGILLHNLYSLTFAGRWRSLTRLTALGAGPRDLLAVTLLENGILYCAAVSSGHILTALCVAKVGIQTRPPLWLTGGILAWIWGVSCLSSIRPLRAALRQTFRESHLLRKGRRKILHHDNLKCDEAIIVFRDNECFHSKNIKDPCSGESVSRSAGKKFTGGKSPRHEQVKHRRKCTSAKRFSGFMTGKYRRANRGQHVRIVLTILAAILLYVPAGYLIETNLSVQRAELEAKHGIQYSCIPGTKAELEQALAEYLRLAEPSSVLYVSMPASASIRTEELSGSMRKMLGSMGWPEEAFFSAEGTLFFLEDACYTRFLESAGLPPAASSVLIDRYINRRSWSGDAVPSYEELPLLRLRNDSSGDRDYGVEVCTGIGNPYDTNVFSPDALTKQIPEGVSFDGSLSLILPLSSLEHFLSPGTEYPRLYVCGKFTDPNEAAYSRLEDALGTDSLGSLRNTREILKEWYSSMSGIHRAMNAICSLLFFIASLNIFSMILFQYMERRRGLAVLWSLGQSPGELLRILTGEHLRNLSAAILLGVPISGLLCYYIYKIFRRVWQVNFAFPLRQTALIGAAACALSLLAVLAEALLMRRQDFLKDLKGIV